MQWLLLWFISTHYQLKHENIIPMSGAADNYWAMYKTNNHLDLAHKIASDFDPRKETDEMVEF